MADPMIKLRFQSMPLQQLQPNVFSYGAYLNACEKMGRWEEALQMYRGSRCHRAVSLGWFREVTEKKYGEVMI